MVRVALDLPLYRLFDYLVPPGIDTALLKPGIRLCVPFGNRQKTAFLLSVDSSSQFPPEKLKPIVDIVDRQPLLASDDLRLLQWAARYYHHPLGEVIASAFPVTLRQGNPLASESVTIYTLTEAGRAIDPQSLKRAPKQRLLMDVMRNCETGLSAREIKTLAGNCKPVLNQLLTKGWITQHAALPSPSKATPDIKASSIVCNPEQKTAIVEVCAGLGRFGVYLLEGVTGSGKTEVYLQIIRRVLEAGRQVLVLLPEITLTPQLEARFRDRFGVAIAVSHSKLSGLQREQAWRAAQSGHGAILLGTRSALFTPMPHLGLVILDEEHDASFKQQEGFRFSARDVAIMRCKLLGIPALLGSATPSLESLLNAQAQRYRLLQLPYRAGNASAPAISVLDIRGKTLQEGISDALSAEIRQTLAKNEQVLLFLNRRGFAPTLICHSCGWSARCDRCDTHLVVHFCERLLRCHHCTKERSLIQVCPACGGQTLTPLGLGTERVEAALTDQFPDATVLRLDRDTTQRKGTLEDYLQQINDGRANIILGTQMLAKGHHFPGVTLVAIMDADSGLYSIDFHAAEKLAQLIVQVIGRAGRADKSGRVLIQTRHPEHPLLTTLIREGYNAFAQQALAERREAALPPFSYHALFRAHSRIEAKSKQFLETVKTLAQRLNSGNIQILGPVPAPMARRANNYRYQLLLQNAKRAALQQLLDKLTPEVAAIKKDGDLHWSIDVDPVDLY